MKSLSLEYLESLSFNSQQLSTLKVIGEFRGKQALFERQTPEVLESLQEVAVVESTESSNRLEGITAPRVRVEALTLRSTKPKNRSEQEIAGYRDALALIHESTEPLPFSANMILQCHSMVHRYVPLEGGRWKSEDNVIVERRPGSSEPRVRFRPVSAEETPKSMTELVRLYDEAIDVHHQEPLVVIPLAVLDFLCVHPFDDGNGRVARLLTLLLLYRFNYDVGRYISLERVFEESKETYYETLETSSKGWHDSAHDSAPWMGYFWGVLIRAYREFEERVGTIRTARGSKTERIRAAVARRIIPFAISDIESELPGISRDMIRVVLRQLRDEGEIRVQGKGRAAKWVRGKD